MYKKKDLPHKTSNIQTVLPDVKMKIVFTSSKVLTTSSDGPLCR